MENDDVQIQIKNGHVCPYCSNPSEYVDSKEVYGNKSYGMVYLCRPCTAYVGVHKGTNKALGRLANAELREAKMEAHHWFDQIARVSRKDGATGVINDVWPIFIPKVSNRAKAYLWLSRHLGIASEDCHIGMFDVEMCKRVTELSKVALDNHKYGLPTRPPDNFEFFKD